MEQRSHRDRRIEGAERHFSQPLLQRWAFGGNRRGCALRKPAAAHEVDGGVALEQDGHTGQLVQPRQQGGQAASRQRELTELAMQVLRAFVQLGAPVDDVAQHRLLDLVERRRRRQREQRKPVRVGDPTRLGRHAPKDRGTSHRLPDKRFDQARDREPRVDRGQHLRIDQQQLPAAKRGEGRRPRPQRGAPDDLAPAAGGPGDQLRLLR